MIRIVMAITRVLISVVGLVTVVSSVRIPPYALAQDVAQVEESLEPEFTHLRATLGARPGFSGADAGSKFRLAEELAHRGDVAGAIERYRAAIELQPDWADPYRGLGQVLLDHHDYAEAVQALQASLRLGSDDHQVVYWLGRALLGQGDLAAAELAFVRAATLKPDDAETLSDLGLVRMARGDVTGAEKALTRSIQIKPDSAEAHRLHERLKHAHRDPDVSRQAGLDLLREQFGRE